MIQDLESLIQLQTIDARIHELTHSKAAFPKELSELEALVTKAQKECDAITIKIAAVESEKKAVQEKVKEANQSLDKSQERLNAIKTNREYDAVHSEIETFKGVIAGADSRIKHCDTEIENLTKANEEKTAELEKIKSDNEAKINELKTKISQIDVQIEEQKILRGKITVLVPKPLMRTYEHILTRKKNGKALSFVNAETHTCSSCFRVLEMQLVNEIHRGTKMLTCQNCGSIFIWDNNDGQQPSAA